MENLLFSLNTFNDPNSVLGLIWTSTYWIDYIDSCDFCDNLFIPNSGFPNLDFGTCILKKFEFREIT